MRHGKILRIIVAAEASLIWSADQWVGTNKMETTNIRALNLWFVDLPTSELRGDSMIEFTVYWKDTHKWEGRNWQIDVEP